MANAKTVEVVAETLDTIEETLDTIERIPKLALNGTTKKQQIIILGTVFVAGVAIGGGATYFLTKRKLRAHYVQIAEQEIAEAKAQYRILNKEGKYADPVTMLQDLSDAEQVKEGKKTVDELGYSGAEVPQSEKDQLLTKESLEKAEYPAPVVVQNIFHVQGLQELDMEVEEELRRNGQPYVISEAEYMEAEGDFEQQRLVYFDGDDVLVDDNEVPIPNVDEIIGETATGRFGHGSGDKNIVYVRNERLQTDYEVVHSGGSYTKEVLGFDVEDGDEGLKHSDRRGKSRRFRGDDE